MLELFVFVKRSVGSPEINTGIVCQSVHVWMCQVLPGNPIWADLRSTSCWQNLFTPLSFSTFPVLRSGSDQTDRLTRCARLVVCSLPLVEVTAELRQAVVTFDLLSGGFGGLWASVSISSLILNEETEKGIWALQLAQTARPGPITRSLGSGANHWGWRRTGGGKQKKGACWGHMMGVDVQDVSVISQSD